MKPLPDFSQWGEQAHILNFFETVYIKEGRFLDLGAFDGVTGSNTRALALKGWNGVCVEASPFAFPRLLETYRKNRRVSLVCGAISQYGGPIGFSDAGDQISTCRRDHHVGRFVREKYWVTAFPPSTLAGVFGTHYDFVSLDIEGIEEEVLPLMEPLFMNTRLLCIEDTLPGCEHDSVYYARMLDKCSRLGFMQTLIRTVDSSGKPANTLLIKP